MKRQTIKHAYYKPDILNDQYIDHQSRQFIHHKLKLRAHH